MKKKKLLLALTIGSITIAAIGAIGFFIWIHTPYFAIQQIGTSLVKRDSQTFYEYIDTANLVNSLTIELLYQPAMNTPSLSEFQRYVANGALIMTKNKIDHALYNGINRLVLPAQNLSTTSFPLSISKSQTLRELVLSNKTRNEWNQTFTESVYTRVTHGVAPTSVSTTSGNILLVANENKKDPLSGLDLKDFAKSFGQELKTEGQDVMRLVARRMQEYLAMRQESLIGKLFAVSRGNGSIKTVLAEYGFQKENIRSMFFQTDDERQVCTFEFYSPKIRANVPFSIELIPVRPGEVLSKWKVIRMWKIKESLNKLGEDTDTQVQGLVAYSLQDVTPKQAAVRTDNLLKRLSQHESTQKLWKQLQDKN